VWWFTPVIPVNSEAKVGELQSEAMLGKSMRPYLKNNLKTKSGRMLA
jgi:hypothetical protein